MESMENAKFTVKGKRELLLAELKKKGCRMTNQRKLLIDIILKDDCCCCKEIYYQAAKQEPSIGVATVYRMVKMLEEMGFLSRRLYQVSYDQLEALHGGEVVLLEEEHITEIEQAGWYQKLRTYLESKGYLNGADFSVIIRKNEPNRVNPDVKKVAKTDAAAMKNAGIDTNIDAGKDAKTEVRRLCGKAVCGCREYRNSGGAGENAPRSAAS